MNQKKISKIKKTIFFKITSFLAVFFASIFLLQNPAFSSQSRTLTVFSESNLSVVLSKISRIFSQKNNVIVSVNFNSSFDLINEIDSGAPADIFISAHPYIIENLRQKGLVDVYNVAYIANDRLALCTSKLNKKFAVDLIKKNTSFEDSLRILNKNKSSLIVNQDGESSGIFTKKLIQSLSLSDIKIFSKLNEDKSSIIRDIENNNDSYGILFKSQLQKNYNLRILAVQKDKGYFYQGFVVAGNNMEVAREFLNFLKTPAAKKIFNEGGFGVE